MLFCHTNDNIKLILVIWLCSNDLILHSQSYLIPASNTPRTSQFMTLSQYLNTKSNFDQGLKNVICSSAVACIKISQELKRLSIRNNYELAYSNEKYSNGETNGELMKMNVQGEIQKEMDVVANEIFIDEVRDSVVVLASEEEKEIIEGGGMC